MTKIYRESFGFFFSSLPILFAFAAVIEVFFWVFQPKSEAASSFVALTLVAYLFHRHFLFGETFTFRNPQPNPGAPKVKLGWFILVSCGLVLIPVVIGFVLAIGYLERDNIVGIILIFVTAYLLILSLFGTALPAAVARDGTYRVSQGLRVTLSTMWRLILGPGVVGFVLVAATILAGGMLNSAGMAEDSLLMLAFFIVTRTLGFLTTILAVSILCEMYRKTRPPSPNGEEAGAMGQTPL
jgi:hypothetical protein